MKTGFYSCFHLNLAFSALEEEARGDVIKRCYWPLLRLAEKGYPIGLEATGYTLEAIRGQDQSWIARAAELIQENRLELIGSGYAQIIAPLAPPELNRQNLLLGQEIYQSLLGTTPRIALVNEQAYSAGLIALYNDAGFDAIMVDWADAHSHNLEWPDDVFGHPQTLIDEGGTSIKLLWSDAIAFQKFQRYAHREIDLSEFNAFVDQRLASGPGVVPLYTSDAEIFDFRPGRFEAETPNGGASEWARVEQLFDAVSQRKDGNLILPSEALTTHQDDRAPIVLTHLEAPVSVKKQRKYNLHRWAVTGRADLALNTHCWRLYEARQAGTADISWATLCQLWASDYRTHITDKRWQAMLAMLPPDPMPRTVPAELSPPANAPKIQSRVDGRFLTLQGERGYVVLNTYRGLAVQAFDFGEKPWDLLSGIPSPGLVGTLAHGTFRDIRLGADFYTGHMVVEPNDTAKIADLNACEPRLCIDDDSAVVEADIQTRLGTIRKTLRFTPADMRLETQYHMPGRWPHVWPDHASVRLGHVKINPARFDPAELYVSTANGGMVERFFLRDRDLARAIDHGAAVSRLISASTGFGMTNGHISIGDSKHRVDLEMQRTDAAAMAHFSYQPVVDTYFCRLALSLQESDETRRGRAQQPADLMARLAQPRIRYAISLHHAEDSQSAPGGDL